MNVLRFISTCIITVTLLIFSIILINPTRELFSARSSTGLGPGVLPAICLVGILLLSVYIFIVELKRYLRLRAQSPHDAPDDAQVIAQYGVPLRTFVTRSAAVLILLGLYVLIWRTISFIPATLLFTISMGLCVMPKAERTKKSMLKLAIILGISSIAIWVIFVHLLGVNLR